MSDTRGRLCIKTVAVIAHGKLPLLVGFSQGDVDFSGSAVANGIGQRLQENAVTGVGNLGS